MIESVYQEAVKVQAWKREEADRDAMEATLEKLKEQGRLWKATPRPGALTRIVRLVVRRLARWVGRESPGQK